MNEMTISINTVEFRFKPYSLTTDARTSTLTQLQSKREKSASVSFELRIRNGDSIKEEEDVCLFIDLIEFVSISIKIEIKSNLAEANNNRLRPCRQQ